MRAEDLLPDDVNQGEFNGATVWKGTVGAFIANAKLWTDPGTSAEDRSVAELHILEALSRQRFAGQEMHRKRTRRSAPTVALPETSTSVPFD
jgi:hypothetical protein